MTYATFPPTIQVSMEGKHTKRWINTRQAADRSGYDVDTIRTLCQEGYIPACKPHGTWRILVADFEAWMNKGSTKP
ncbi:MAG TPA: helix-turn-helix domain-containing protein [Thermoguttaceae bacterium]|nr:helix-turn-helix domain-containing protein [Thermoguttaceae bacterium]